MAKRRAFQVFLQASVYASVVSLALYQYRNELVELYTGDKSETAVDVTLALGIIPLFSFTNLVDMGLSYFNGLVRALGIQANVALISISCFYLISLPAATYLGFVAQAGLRGMWFGYFLGISIQILILAWLTWSTDWQQLADDAEIRLKNVQREASKTLKKYALEEDSGGEDDELQSLISSKAPPAYKKWEAAPDLWH